MDQTVKQTVGIYEYMRDVGPINGMIALERHRCWRLPARIKDLKNKGIEIKDDWITYVNEYGEKKRCKEYWLA